MCIHSYSGYSIGIILLATLCVGCQQQNSQRTDVHANLSSDSYSNERRNPEELGRADRIPANDIHTMQTEESGARFDISANSENSVAANSYRQSFVSRDGQRQVTCGNVSSVYVLGSEKSIAFYNRGVLHKIISIGFGGNIIGANAPERQWVYFTYHNNSGATLAAYDYSGQLKWERSIGDTNCHVTTQNVLHVSENNDRIVLNLYDASRYMEGKAIITDLDGRELCRYEKPYSVIVSDSRGRAVLFLQNEYILYDLNNNCEVLRQKVANTMMISCPYITQDEMHVLLPLFQTGNEQEVYLESFVELDIKRGSVQLLKMTRCYMSYFDIIRYDYINKQVVVNTVFGQQEWVLE